MDQRDTEVGSNAADVNDGPRTSLVNSSWLTASLSLVLDLALHGFASMTVITADFLMPL